MLWTEAQPGTNDFLHINEISRNWEHLFLMSDCIRASLASAGVEGEPPQSGLGNIAPMKHGR